MAGEWERTLERTPVVLFCGFSPAEKVFTLVDDKKTLTISQSLSGPILNPIKPDFVLTAGLQPSHSQPETLYISNPIYNLSYNYNFSFNP